MIIAVYLNQTLIIGVVNMKGDFLDKLIDEENKEPNKVKDMKYIAEVKFPKSHIILALFILVILVIYNLIYFYNINDKDKSDLFMLILANLIFIPTCFCLIISYINVRYKYDNKGFIARTMFRKEERYEYSDIIFIVPFSNKSVVTYTLEMKNGKKIAISMKCREAKQFLDVIEFSKQNAKKNNKENENVSEIWTSRKF